MSEESILSFLKEKGPSTPVQVARHLDTSMLFASAMLSQVASKGRVGITHLKIGGGSPLYYLKEDKERLQEFAEKLGNKEKRAYDLLLEKGVLKDSEQEPLVRVSLRAIKDYAIPLTVTQGEVRETFWKWYLLSEVEAKEKIGDLLGEKEEAKQERKETTTKPEEAKEPKKQIEGFSGILTGKCTRYPNFVLPDNRLKMVKLYRRLGSF